MYFSTNVLGGHTTTNPDLYMHMLSENYTNQNRQLASGLRSNWLITEIVDWFGQVNNASEHELCLAVVRVSFLLLLVRKTLKRVLI